MSYKDIFFLIIIFLNVPRNNILTAKDSIITLTMKSGYNKIYNNNEPSEMYIKALLN